MRHTTLTFSISFCLQLLIFVPLQPAAGQQVADSLFEWRGYIHPGKSRVRIYKTMNDKNRTHTVILQEIAQNKGPSVHDDLPYLVEEISRAYQLDASLVYWVLHWGKFTFVDAKSSKELFLRATFKRKSNGQLGTPQWRLIRREDVEEMTDRQFR